MKVIELRRDARMRWWALYETATGFVWRERGTHPVPVTDDDEPIAPRRHTNGSLAGLIPRRFGGDGAIS